MKILNNFINSKNKLQNYFNIEEDYFIKDFSHLEWSILKNNEIFFLTIKDLDKKNKINQFVIVKKDDLPIIIEKENLTLIIALDCVKVAFIVRNKNKIDDIL